MRERLQIENDKIYLPLLLVIAVITAAPFVFAISVLDIQKGYLVRQVLKLSFKFVILRLVARK